MGEGNARRWFDRTSRDCAQDPYPAEQKLWFALRAERFAGVKFRRQKVIGLYIADFAANLPKLVVEVDGHLHGDTAEYDAKRTACLTELGYRVVRFTNADVMHNLEGVLTVLEGFVTHPLSQPSPLKGRGL